jgi:hypothetical protein
MLAENQLPSNVVRILQMSFLGLSPGNSILPWAHSNVITNLKNTAPYLLIYISKEIKFTNNPRGPGDPFTKFSDSVRHSRVLDGILYILTHSAMPDPLTSFLET